MSFINIYLKNLKDNFLANAKFRFVFIRHPDKSGFN